MRTLSLFFFSLGFSSISVDGPQYAWWMNARVDTTCSEGQSGTVAFNGICYVLLSQEVVSRIPGYEQQDISETGAKFRLEFPTRTLATKYYATSVYKDREGRSGRALIVSLDSDFKKIVRVETREGIPGFSALFVDGDKLIWSFCLYCGDYVPIATLTQ